MSEELALLAAIRDSPDEDTPRLVYADWLQEHDREARAELIRVQVELTRVPPRPRELFVADGAGTRMEGLGVALLHRGRGHFTASAAERGLSIETFEPNERVDIYADRPGKGIRWMRGMRYVRHTADGQEIVFRKDDGSGPWIGLELVEREFAILKEWGGDRWRAGPKCEQCNGKGGWKHIGAGGLPGSLVSCLACFGTGDAGGLVRRGNNTPGRNAVKFPWRNHIGYVRGMKRVYTASIGDCIEQVYGNYQPSYWLATVVAAHPDVVEVWAEDKRPYHNGYGWSFFNSGRDRASRLTPQETELPHEVFEALNGRADPAVKAVGERFFAYPTFDAAKVALARTFVRWATSTQ